MHETIAVGRAAGVEFPPDFAAELDRWVASFPPTMKASMANDLEAGNRLELDWLAGKVVALGRKYGIATPAHEAVYGILKPYRLGRGKENRPRPPPTRGRGGPAQSRGGGALPRDARAFRGICTLGAGVGRRRH